MKTIVCAILGTLMLIMIGLREANAQGRTEEMFHFVKRAHSCIK